MELDEIDFIAEKEFLTIVPNFKASKTAFICGELGPFIPDSATDVPLWFAINLKQRQKCRIKAPDWLDTEKLNEWKDQEKSSDIFTSPISKHYMEISSILLKHGADDIPNADEIRTLIKDIWDIRVAKLRKSIDLMITHRETHAQVDNITVMEFHTVRAFLMAALDQMHNFRCCVAQLTD